MKKTLIIVGMLALLIIGGLGGSVLGVAGTVAVATHSQDGPFRRLIVGEIGRFMTLGSELNLTDDQKSQIRQIVQSHRTEIAGVVKPLVDKRRALRDATRATPVNETAIRTAAADLTQSIGDAAVLAAKIKLEVRNIMTPRQAQQIDEFRKQSDSAVDDFVQELSKA